MAGAKRTIVGTLQAQANHEAEAMARRGRGMINTRQMRVLVLLGDLDRNASNRPNAIGTRETKHLLVLRSNLSALRVTPTYPVCYDHL